MTTKPWDCLCYHSRSMNSQVFEAGGRKTVGAPWVFMEGSQHEAQRRPWGSHGGHMEPRAIPGRAQNSEIDDSYTVLNGVAAEGPAQRGVQEGPKTVKLMTVTRF